VSEFLKGDVVAALEKAGRPLKSKEVARELGIPGGDYREFRRFLKHLVETGDLYQVKRGRYAPPARINLTPGVVQVIRRGGAFLIAEKGGDDIYISQENLGTAHHGDKVVVRLEHRRGGRPEGRVLRILERASTQFVGTVQHGAGFYLVKPDDPRFKTDVFVPPGDADGARDGEKVIVAIEDWGSPTSAPVGRISERLGMPGDPGLDVLLIVKNSGLPTGFPEAVEAAAEAIPDRIPESEIASRVDLRGVQVVTIDPPNARDFDDALSLEELDDGNFELGVHIADVSHYVRHDDPIDEEAWQRGTSVYLVDRVLPMLPEKLSNGLCSLNPEEDRLAMSVLARITPRGRVLDYRIADTVIRSKRRLAYEQVQAVFDGDADMAAELKPVLPLLERLRGLARTLNAKRKSRGALDFDLPSSRVILDAEGLPVDIQKVLRTESNRLVEEFMLLANELVAKHLKQPGKAGVYRVHEDPKEGKLDDLQELIARFGFQLYPGADGRVPPKELQRVLREASDTPHETIVHTLVLRSLMRARYDIHPLGHYGLALKDYTHFTSPIRRYPDLLVHRILRMESGRQRPAFDHPERFREWLDEACERSSERERLAEDAERDSVELKKIQFMERHLGDEFDGVITGVEAFGFFVELSQYHVSGLVHVNNLEDDYYEYREDEFALIGANAHRRFSLGERVRVQVMAVKRELRQIDFLLISGGGRAEDTRTVTERLRAAQSEFDGSSKKRRRPHSEATDGRRRGGARSSGSRGRGRKSGRRGGG